MELFIKFQVPSDLLSFDPAPVGFEVLEPTSAERLEAVKDHVQAMLEMIKTAKAEELSGAREEAQYERYRSGSISSECGASMCDDGAEVLMEECKKSVPQRKGFRAFAARSSSRVAEAHTQSLSQSVNKSHVRRRMSNDQDKAERAPTDAKPRPRPTSTSSETPPQQPQPGQTQQPETGGVASDIAFRDYTRVPKEMDEKFETMDTDGSLRPTIIKPAEQWTKKAQKALLASPHVESLGADEQKSAKDAAFDLLDALTKSGALPVEHASLHIVVAATHCFDKSVLETVVQDNVNPIDKVERSTLIIASTVHQQPVEAIIAPDHIEKVQGKSPMLFLEDDA